MLLVFGCHDYGNGYFYRVQIWLQYGNSCCYLFLFLFETSKGNLYCQRAKEVQGQPGPASLDKTQTNTKKLNSKSKVIPRPHKLAAATLE
jgi:hypothetical protein